MRYTINLDLPDKPNMKQAHFFVPEPIYREFTDVAKSKGIPMTKVVVEFMKNFCAEHYGKQSKQQEMF